MTLDLLSEFPHHLVASAAKEFDHALQTITVQVARLPRDARVEIEVIAQVRS